MRVQERPHRITGTDIGTGLSHRPLIALARVLQNDIDGGISDSSGLTADHIQDIDSKIQSERPQVLVCLRHNTNVVLCFNLLRLVGLIPGLATIMAHVVMKKLEHELRPIAE